MPGPAPPRPGGLGGQFAMMPPKSCRCGGEQWEGTPGSPPGVSVPGGTGGRDAPAIPICSCNSWALTPAGVWVVGVEGGCNAHQLKAERKRKTLGFVWGSVVLVQCGRGNPSSTTRGSPGPHHSSSLFKGGVAPQFPIFFHFLLLRGRNGIIPPVTTPHRWKCLFFQPLYLPLLIWGNSVAGVSGRAAQSRRVCLLWV